MLLKCPCLTHRLYPSHTARHRLKPRLSKSLDQSRSLSRPRRYLLFFCPLNLFYKCVAFLPVKLVLVALKEVVRTRKIAAGVHHAFHAYHHGFFIMVIVGYVKGDPIPPIPPLSCSVASLVAC